MAYPHGRIASDDDGRCWLEHRGLRVRVDEDGFLAEPEAWSSELAAVLADADGVPELTDGHWRVMDFVRSHWRERGAAPMIRVLCRETGFSLREIYDLFPQGPAHGACKYAGLPVPDGCV
jgi:tRNA 2-thiouridine synthesizing protein E